MKIRRRCHCRIPRRIESRLHFPFHSKEIRPPPPLRIERRRQAPQRHRQFCRPRSRRLVLHNSPPQTAAHLFFLAVPNIQVNPEPVRAHFQFYVYPRVAHIRLQKRLRHVALPQFVSPPIRPRILKHMQLPIPRKKPQKQRLRVPQQAHLRRALRIRLLASPIALKTNRGRLLPASCLWKSLPPHAFFQQQRVSRGQFIKFRNRSLIHRPDSVVHHRIILLILQAAGNNPCATIRPVSSASRLFAHSATPPSIRPHPSMLPSALDPFRKEKLLWKHAAPLWPIATSRFAPNPPAAIQPIFNS